MKKNLAVIGVICAISGLSYMGQAHASGSGVRGGGQIVDVDTNPQLADLVTKAVCDEWVTGEDLVKAHPAFESEIIAPLQVLDWYFADAILNEARNLRFCMTGPLYTIAPVDWGVPVLPPDQSQVRQIAYRINDEVYMDEALFDAPNMSERTRAYVLLHEAMHSFFPMDVVGRQLKLRTMVKDISKVESGEIKTRRAIHDEMTNNDVDFPLTVTLLDPSRAQIEFLLEPTDLQGQDLVGLKEIDSILDLPNTTIDELASWDSYYIRSTGTGQIVAQAYLSRMISNDISEFKALLTDPRFARLSPAAILFAYQDQLSDDKKALILSPGGISQVYQAWYGELMNPTLIKTSEGRAALDAGAAAMLGDTSGAATPVLDMPLPGGLPTCFDALIDLLDELTRKGEMDQVQALAGAGSPFSDLINLTAIQVQLVTFDYDFAIEKRMDSRRVALYAEELKKRILKEVTADLTADQLKQFLAVVPALN
jgi:hypothetical protein